MVEYMIATRTRQHGETFEGALHMIPVLFLTFQDTTDFRQYILWSRRLQFKQHVSQLAASAKATSQQSLQFTTDHRGREYSQ